MKNCYFDVFSSKKKMKTCDHRFSFAITESFTLIVAVFTIHLMSPFHEDIFPKNGVIINVKENNIILIILTLFRRDWNYYFNWSWFSLLTVMSIIVLWSDYCWYCILVCIESHLLKILNLLVCFWECIYTIVFRLTIRVETINGKVLI